MARNCGMDIEQRAVGVKYKNANHCLSSVAAKWRQLPR
jgi:hypothetical protein